MRVLGEENVTHVCVDDYHRYDRRQRAERNITPLHPECNYMDMMAQHLAHLRAGEPFLKPVYKHEDGTFGPLVRVDPKQFAVVDGLLGYYTDELRKLYDVRLYLAPPEELRRKWKVQRDCSRRGYTTDQVLAELDRREPDSDAFIRPQQRYADIVVSFLPNSGSDQEHLDAELILRPTLRHPDFRSVLDGEVETGDGIHISEADGEMHLRIPGRLERRAGQGARGDDLGRPALREPSALRPARRVHDRHRPAPLGIARADPAPDPVPPLHGDGERRPRRRGSPRAGGGSLLDRGSAAGVGFPPWW